MQIQDILEYAKELVYVDEKATIQDVYTKIIAHNISLVPVLGGDRNRNIGVYKRKDLFEWLMKDKNKLPLETQKATEKSPLLKKIREVSLDTPLDEALKELKGETGILIKENNQYTKLLTPRVVADFTYEYTRGFLVLEKLEQLIRNRISTAGIDVSIFNKETISNERVRQIKSTTELSFSQYITLFEGESWEKLQQNGLANFSQETIFKYLRDVMHYRNKLMHFRISDKAEQSTRDGLKSAENLIRLLSELSTPDTNSKT